MGGGNWCVVGDDRWTTGGLRMIAVIRVSIEVRKTTLTPVTTGPEWANFS